MIRVLPSHRFTGIVLSALLAAPPLSAQMGPEPDPLPPVDAQSEAIVAAADAFLATLTDDQKTATLFDFSDTAQRTRWSNFPDGAADRRGIRIDQMDDTQRAALFVLLGAILSEAGVQNVRAQLAADDAVAATETEAPETNEATDTSGRPPVNFGSANYYTAFLGEPSTTSPFMVQFGGHHLAINATVVGPDVTLSPMLTGGEPLRVNVDGEATVIAAAEVAAADAFIAALTDDQRAKAVISDTRINLILGPGEDGRTLPPVGLPGSALDAAQKDLLLALIEARLGMLNADDLAAAMAPVAPYLDQTFFAWWGPTTPGEPAYFRITGPTVLIEFSPEDNDGDASNHAHNIYRDPTNEYGAAWTDIP